jgi:flavin-dependent dehydrogenase
MVERGNAPGEKVISGLVIPIYGFLFGPAFIREGNPPIERPICSVVNRFVKDGEIYDTDRSLTVPKPLALGYAAYCKPFCAWLADRAVEAGVELRTATVATDVIIEDGAVRGIVTDGGEAIRARLVIDSGGTQNNLALKAGIRKKFLPEAIELYMLWDFEMAKEDVDAVFGHSMEFFHAMPGESISAPQGYGSTLYFFTYRDSIHPGLGQFLVTQGKVPNVAKLLPQYYENFTETIQRWKKDIEPRVKLRATMWDVCPIYAGLIPETRRMPIYGDGILFIGDAAGFESSAFGDGVPQAWFSAEIAASVALKSLQVGDTSRRFLSQYEERVKADPFLIHCITDWRRWDMRKVIASGDEKEFKKRIRDAWGIGAFRYQNMGGPCLKAMARGIRQQPTIPASWLEMFSRYFRNWEHNSFDRLSSDK